MYICLYIHEIWIFGDIKKNNNNHHLLPRQTKAKTMVPSVPRGKVSRVPWYWSGIASWLLSPSLFSHPVDSKVPPGAPCPPDPEGPCTLTKCYPWLLAFWPHHWSSDFLDLMEHGCVTGLTEEFGWLSCFRGLPMRSAMQVANSRDHLPVLHVPIRCW